jgi:hypothetical protein
MDGCNVPSRQEDEETFGQSDGANGGGSRFGRVRVNGPSSLYSIPSLPSFPDSYNPVDLSDVANPPDKHAQTPSTLPNSSIGEGGGGGGGGGGGVGRVGEPPQSSFEMFQKTQQANGGNQLFRFDSGGSNGSFVRTFYLDPTPHSHLDHTSHTLMDASSSHTHHDHNAVTHPHHDLSMVASHHDAEGGVMHTEASASRDTSDNISVDVGRTHHPDPTHSLPSDLPLSSSSSSSSSSSTTPSSSNSGPLLLHAHSLPPSQSSLLPVPSSSSSSFASSSSTMMLSNAVSSGSGHQYVDITEYLNMPQYVAARKLGTLSLSLSHSLSLSS